MTIKRFAIALLPLSLAFAPLPAVADAASEIATAATHATMAAQSSSLNMVHSHLHHVLNCLVGVHGADFDTAEVNPCAGAGNGAIPDTADTAKQKSLESAADKAREGIKASDLKAAQQAATDAASMLKAVK